LIFWRVAGALKLIVGQILQKRPPILPGERFLCEPCLVVFVSSVPFGERKAIVEEDE
jgi:hypothetical protein